MAVQHVVAYYYNFFWVFLKLILLYSLFSICSLFSIFYVIVILPAAVVYQEYTRLLFN